MMAGNPFRRPDVATREAAPELRLDTTSHQGEGNVHEARTKMSTRRRTTLMQTTHSSAHLRRRHNRRQGKGQEGAEESPHPVARRQPGLAGIP